MKILLKTFLSIAMVSCLCTTPVFAATADNPQSWYIKRNDSHKQPATALSASELNKYGAYCVDTLHGDGCEDKVIYLTFDAGYENGNIAKILDALKEESVPAAFFVLKNMITKEKALIERMNNEGHLVCNHTMTHKDMSHAGNDTLTSELKGLEALYTKTTGKELAKYYRPPEGRFTLSNLKTAQALGYKTVFWSFAYADWDNDKQPSEEMAIEKVLTNTHNGEVVLLHPTSSTNASILPKLIKEWKKMGYRFGTLDELTGEGAK